MLHCSCGKNTSALNSSSISLNLQLLSSANPINRSYCYNICFPSSLSFWTPKLEPGNESIQNNARKSQWLERSNFNCPKMSEHYFSNKKSSIKPTTSVNEKHTLNHWVKPIKNNYENYQLSPEKSFENLLVETLVFPGGCYWSTVHTRLRLFMTIELNLKCD